MVEQKVFSEEMRKDCMAYKYESYKSVFYSFFYRFAKRNLLISY